MSKVLLLTAGYGEGHNAAARGLHAALTELGTEAEIVDLFAQTGGAFYEKTRKGYIDLINKAPNVWATAYGLIDKIPIGAMSLPFLGKMRQALADLIEKEKPMALVSVYPSYGYLIESLYPKPEERPFAFHTVVTDSITINSVWYRCASDTFVVPNAETASVMKGRGVPAGKVHALGFPVPPRFSRDRPERPASTTPRILFMINAAKDQAPGIVSRLLQVRPPLHLTVTVGKDEALRSRVEAAAAAADQPIEIHGWTPHMPELLMSHHVLIGKAGGAAVQETIAAATPMLITSVVPGQEEGNAELLFRNECGALCPSPDALAEKIEELFANDAADWKTWEHNIQRLSRPDAALQIARFVREFRR